MMRPTLARRSSTNARMAAAFGAAAAADSLETMTDIFAEPRVGSPGRLLLRHDCPTIQQLNRWEQGSVRTRRMRLRFRPGRDARTGPRAGAPFRPRRDRSDRR